MDPGVAVDAEPESFVRDFIENSLPKLYDVFLKGLVPGGVIEHLSDDPGIARPEDIVFGNPNKVSHPESCHKRIV